jgi:hypothetical protein
MQNGSSSNSTITCCRHEDANPFVLHQTTTTSNDDDNIIIENRELSAEQLERIVTRRLIVAEEEQQDVLYSVRYDAHWLQCCNNNKVPVVHPTTHPTTTTTQPPMATIFGIPEDEGTEDIPVQISIFQPSSSSLSDDGNGTINIRCRCQGPHSDWKRRQRQESLPQPPQPQPQQLHLSWMDLRTVSSPLVTSQAGVMHLLQSLLSPSHAASPWGNNDNDEEDSHHHPNSSHKIPPDIVVLVVPHDDEMLEVLKDFRVSDAAPSWFLHAIAFCDQLESDPEQLFGGFGVGVGGGSSSSFNHHSGNPHPPGTLYIYKRLASRPQFLSTPPPSSDALTTSTTTTTQQEQPTTVLGCLWERIDPSPSPSSSPSSSMPVEELLLLTSPPPPEPTYRLSCPPYLNFFEEYPKPCHALFAPESLEIFRQEALRIPQWTPWPETQHYSSGSGNSGSGNNGNGTQTKPWTVFPLCYCFPANQPQNRKWVEATLAHCPNTCRLLEDCLGPTLRTALFSQLAPNTVLEPHTGWADLANHVLRLHIPLVVPSTSSSLSSCDNDNNNHNNNNDTMLCGTWVDGCVETHKVGRPLLFDDSKIHRAFNYSSSSSSDTTTTKPITRIVLIVDLERPKDLPLGTATGGHSEELDAFIQQMSVPQ